MQRSSLKGILIAVVVIAVPILFFALTYRPTISGEKEVDEWFGPDFVSLRVNRVFVESIIDAGGEQIYSTKSDGILAGCNLEIWNESDVSLPLRNISIELVMRNGGQEITEDLPYLYTYALFPVFPRESIQEIEPGGAATVYAFMPEPVGTEVESVNFAFQGRFEKGPLNTLRDGPRGALMNVDSFRDLFNGLTRYRYTVHCK